MERRALAICMMAGLVSFACGGGGSGSGSSSGMATDSGQAAMSEGGAAGGGGASDSSGQSETGAAQAGGGDQSSMTQVSKFMSYSAADSTVDLQIWAGYNGTNSAWNYNGSAKGNATYTVPLGWKVNVTFRNNDANVVHSVGIAEQQQPLPGSGEMAKIAFEGATSRKFGTGLTSADKPSKFSFVADEAGKYLMMCGVPGHAQGGMWDWFVVSKDAQKPDMQMGGSGQ